jgi:hypothetical protein
MLVINTIVLAQQSILSSTINNLVVHGKGKRSEKGTGASNTCVVNINRNSKVNFPSRKH